jgi:tetratricopeptide (TPR) repeat protein
VSELRRHGDAQETPLPGDDTMVSMLSRWENGRRTPDAFYQRLLCHAFDLPRIALGFDDRAPAVTPPTHAEGSDTALPHLRSEALSPTVVDHGLLDDLRALTDSYRRVDRRLGATAVHTELSRHLERMLGLRSLATRASARRRLAFLAGDAAALLGWQALDSGRPDEAWSRFRVGARAARESGDAALHAFIVAEMAYVPLFAGRSSDALDLVDHAVTIAGTATPPAFRAWLTATKAETLAACGDESASLAAMGQASTLLDTVDEGEPPSPGTSYFDRSHLERWRGQCLVEIGRIDDAHEVITAALDRVDPSFVRARAGMMLDLATAYARRDDLDQACHTAVKALWLARQTNSRRYQQRVVMFRTWLEPRADAQPVRWLDEAMHAA